MSSKVNSHFLILLGRIDSLCKDFARLEEGCYPLGCFTRDWSEGRGMVEKGVQESSIGLRMESEDALY